MYEGRRSCEFVGGVVHDANQGAQRSKRGDVLFSGTIRLTIGVTSFCIRDYQISFNVDDLKTIKQQAIEADKRCISLLNQQD